MKLKNMEILIILLFILLVLGFLYRRFEEKKMREENKVNYDAIKEYLLDNESLEKSKKPILWLYIPYEYNSRRWLSFGSRSSFELNQPYLELTIRSIIKNCKKSFTICIIDDNSLNNLLNEWKINMSILSEPILSNMRILGIIKLIYKYGGMICPISFLCMKDLIGLYTKGTIGNKMFICEGVNINSLSNGMKYNPNINFWGAPKECKIVSNLCNYIEIIISHDQSDECKFLGKYELWCLKKIEERKINIIEGIEIGTKTIDEKPILLDDLMSNNYLDLYKGTYGILIPSKELLKRINYGWFVRLSPRQVIESNTIIGNYILLSIGNEDEGILEPLQVKPNWVSFWKIPSGAPNWGLKPLGVGDNVRKKKTP